MDGPRRRRGPSTFSGAALLAGPREHAATPIPNDDPAHTVRDGVAVPRDRLRGLGLDVPRDQGGGGDDAAAPDGRRPLPDRRPAAVRNRAPARGAVCAFALTCSDRGVVARGVA